MWEFLDWLRWDSGLLLLMLLLLLLVRVKEGKEVCLVWRSEDGNGFVLTD